MRTRNDSYFDVCLIFIPKRGENKNVCIHQWSWVMLSPMRSMVSCEVLPVIGVLTTSALDLRTRKNLSIKAVAVSKEP